MAKLSRDRIYLLDEWYLAQKSRLLGQLSSFYLEDTDYLSIFEDVIPQAGVLEHYIAENEGGTVAVTFRLVQARLHFLHASLARPFLQDARKRLAKLPQQEKVPASIRIQTAFLELLFGIHHGTEASILLQRTREVLAEFDSLSYLDPTVIFYNLLLSCIVKGPKKVKKECQKHEATTFSGEISFLSGFILIIMNRLDPQQFPIKKGAFIPLRTAPNVHIAIWSRIFELIYFYEKGMQAKCEAVIRNLREYMLRHKSKRFCQWADHKILELYEQRVLGKELPSRDDSRALPFIHRLMLPQ